MLRISPEEHPWENQHVHFPVFSRNPRSFNSQTARPLPAKQGGSPGWLQQRGRAEHSAGVWARASSTLSCNRSTESQLALPSAPERAAPELKPGTMRASQAPGWSRWGAGAAQGAAAGHLRAMGWGSRGAPPALGPLRAPPCPARTPLPVSPVPQLQRCRRSGAGRALSGCAASGAPKHGRGAAGPAGEGAGGAAAAGGAGLGRHLGAAAGGGGSGAAVPAGRVDAGHRAGGAARRRRRLGPAAGRQRCLHRAGRGAGAAGPAVPQRRYRGAGGPPRAAGAVPARAALTWLGTSPPPGQARPPCPRRRPRARREILLLFIFSGFFFFLSFSSLH